MVIRGIKLNDNVAESIRCLGQEIEQYEVCSPEFNLNKFVFVLQLL